MKSRNLSAGTLFVGPDPPIPKRIFFSPGLILNLFFANAICFFLTSILGSGLTNIFNSFLINFCAALIICWFFLLNTGY